MTSTPPRKSCRNSRGVCDDGKLSALTTFPLERVFVLVNGKPLAIIAFNAFSREPFPPLEKFLPGFRRKTRFVSNSTA